MGELVQAVQVAEIFSLHAEECLNAILYTSDSMMDVSELLILDLTIQDTNTAATYYGSGC